MKQVYIIYNPKSTGRSRANAEALQSKLQAKQIACKLIGTKRAGQARDLAAKYAGPDRIIISSSGDGGFNEVINGILNSQYPETVVGLLASGNANDHHTARHRGNLVTRIAQTDVKKYDGLRVSWSDQVHFAHSYVGLGMTAVIGKQLTEHELNPLLEVWLVLRNLFRRRPVRIKIDGRTRSYDSFVCSVVSKMAKYLNFPDDESRPHGEFIIARRRAGSLSELLRHLFHLSLRPRRDAPSAKRLVLTTLAETPLQLDGEVIDLPAKTEVTIECLPASLQTII